MNKDLINELPADEQVMAEKISFAAETMKLSQNFEWNLETQLMDAYQSKRAGAQGGSFMKFAALVVVFLLSWAVRTLLPKPQPAAPPTPTQEESFVANVRNGDICAGPLAVVHGFSAFLTNEDRTGFVELDAGKTIGEIRNFAWSEDGKQLAIFGNSWGSGTIYITDPSGGKRDSISRFLQYLSSRQMARALFSMVQTKLPQAYSRLRWMARRQESSVD